MKNAGDCDYCANPVTKRTFVYDHNLCDTCYHDADVMDELWGESDLDDFDSEDEPYNFVGYDESNES